ncbi:MAG TPA: hypothetical protein VLF14_05245 [Candidatus Binatia bacterium]|nr:hypothetical protein [Candidatus Binatia bacterium]
MILSDVAGEHGTQPGSLPWFGRKLARLGRKRESGDDSAATIGVASDLAEFLVQATEGSALRQAIDAGVRAQEHGEAEPH